LLREEDGYCYAMDRGKTADAAFTINGLNLPRLQLHPRAQHPAADVPHGAD
jgi:hypothetical protein